MKKDGTMFFATFPIRALNSECLPDDVAGIFSFQLKPRPGFEELR